jgi:hypothetical protein
MLTFAPTQFDGSYETLAPENAWRELAARLGQHLPEGANHPSHSDYRQAQAASNSAYEAIKAALEKGELLAYAVPAGTHAFFSIPADYWLSTTGLLIGKIMGNAIDAVIPEPVIGLPVVIRRDNWELWVESSHPLSPGIGGGISTGAAETECKAWLAAAFAADPNHRRKKENFRSDALTRFAGRLSLRGFNDRVWPELARKHGRDSAGAKKKS